MIAPAGAQNYGVAVTPPAPSPPTQAAPAQPYLPYAYPAYPLPDWVRPNSVCYEQDQLLTDQTPCGAESTTPLPPCQQDRLLTDRTPCTKP